MGDRGEICIKHDDGEVWLYSHWGGYRLPWTVKRALAKKDRWDDDPLQDTTSFGISTSSCEHEYPVVVVDIPRQCVVIGSHEWSFLGYSNADDSDINIAYKEG